MARVWYHIDESTGQWTEWAAGTLPSGVSAFNKHFLNQFLGWMLYVDNYTREYSAANYPSVLDGLFLSGGENVQTPDFWNKLGTFDPANETNEFIGSSWKEFLDDNGDPLESIEVDVPYTEQALKDADAYAETVSPTAPFDVSTPYENGDVLQPARAEDSRLLNLLLQLRTRLDLCRACRIDFTTAMYSAILSYSYLINTTPPTPSSGTTNFPSGNWQGKQIFADLVQCIYEESGGVFDFTGNTYIYQLYVKQTESQSAESSNHKLLISGIKGGSVQDPALQPFSPWSGSLSWWKNDAYLRGKFIVEVNATGSTEVVNGSYGAETVSSYFPPSSDEEANLDLENFYVVLNDELPDAFKPSAGFPWET